MTAEHNPFRVSRIHGLPFLWPDGLDPASLTQRWEQAGRRGALVAPKGHGKTTLLHAWTHHLSTLGWRIAAFRLTEEVPRLSSDDRKRARACGPGHIAVLDGAEQLSLAGRMDWNHCIRHAGGSFLTLHRPRHGCPTLATLSTSPRLLSTLLLHLLDGDLTQLPATPHNLLAQHHGDIRAVFRHLYSIWAASKSL